MGLMKTIAETDHAATIAEVNLTRSRHRKRPGIRLDSWRFSTGPDQCWLEKISGQRLGRVLRVEETETPEPAASMNEEWLL